jgi:hypothetical protein
METAFFYKFEVAVTVALAFMYFRLDIVYRIVKGHENITVSEWPPNRML